jgi:hypothetical protein
MSPEHEQQGRVLFVAALQCEPATRAALLDALCGGDTELRAAVERLLVDDEAASQDHFLTLPDPVRDADAGLTGLVRLHNLSIHLRCPHCQNPIELAALPDSDEVLCAMCGSTFRLETESTVPLGLG